MIFLANVRAALDQILDTMLHELCHNAYGPHNASFYKLWDELRKVSLFLALLFMCTMQYCIYYDIVVVLHKLLGNDVEYLFVGFL